MQVKNTTGFSPRLSSGTRPQVDARHDPNRCKLHPNSATPQKAVGHSGRGRRGTCFGRADVQRLDHFGGQWRPGYHGNRRDLGTCPPRCGPKAIHHRGPLLAIGRRERAHDLGFLGMRHSGVAFRGVAPRLCTRQLPSCGCERCTRKEEDAPRFGRASRRECTSTPWLGNT